MKFDATELFKMCANEFLHVNIFNIYSTIRFEVFHHVPAAFHSMFQGNDLKDIFFGKDVIENLTILFLIGPINEPSYTMVFFIS